MRREPARDVVTMSLDLDFGIDGENRDTKSAIFRPWRWIAGTGRPTGTVNWMFLETGEPVVRLRILGSVCFTPAKRVLYFPGFVSHTLIVYDKDSSPVDEREFEIDHFSLEPTGRRWHITNSNRDHIEKNARLSRSART